MSASFILSAFRDPEFPVVRVTWPRKEDWSLAKASEELGLGPEFQRLDATARTLDALHSAPVPIVGVMGLLNSGKSSFVARFLSPEGRSRVLRGEGESSGTQRFVFWLPASWKQDQVVMVALHAMLESCFGQKAEELAEDETAARRQYNGDGDVESRFATPLLAFDTALTRMALLDCPDVERPHPGEEGVRRRSTRQNFLASASRLMSALVVVADRANLESELLASCVSNHLQLGDKPRFLLINLIKPDTPVEIFYQPSEKGINDLRLSLKVDDLFGAFDYEARNAQDRIPASGNALGKGERFPTFFRISRHACENEPVAVGADRLVDYELGRLDPRGIWQETCREVEKRVIKELRQLRRQLNGRISEQQSSITKLQDGLLDFIRTIAAPGGILRFPISPSIAGQIGEALWDRVPSAILEAPFGRNVHPDSQWVVECYENCWDAKNKLVKVMKWPGGRLDDSIEDVRRKKLKVVSGSSFFSPRDLAEAVREQRWFPDDACGDVALVWKQTLERVRDTPVPLPLETVRKFADKVWECAREFSIFGFFTIQVPTTTNAIDLCWSSVAIAMLPYASSGPVILFAESVSEMQSLLGLESQKTGDVGQALEEKLIEVGAIPLYRELVLGAFEEFGLPLRFEKQRFDRFENTDQFPLDIGQQRNEPLTSTILIADGLHLATEVAEIWSTLEESLTHKR